MIISVGCQQMRKRASIEFIAIKQDGAELKFGGEPYGLPPSLWPTSKASREPMQFICQIPFGPDLFPDVAEAVAYLFMSTGDIEGTWLPDGGENAVVIVPRHKLTGSITVGNAPRLSRMVKQWWSRTLVPEPCTFSARLAISSDPDFIPAEGLAEFSESQRVAYRTALLGNKLGGNPCFLQWDELPFSDGWHLLLQLDSATVPFWINFGDAGIGYAFLNSSGTEGRFLWQCL